MNTLFPPGALPHNQPSPRFCVAGIDILGAPVLDAGLLLVKVKDKQAPSRLFHALDLRDGSILWDASLPGRAPKDWTSPGVAPDGTMAALVFHNVKRGIWLHLFDRVFG